MGCLLEYEVMEMGIGRILHKLEQPVGETIKQRRFMDVVKRFDGTEEEGGIGKDEGRRSNAMNPKRATKERRLS